MRPGGLEPLARHKSAPWYAELRSELLRLPAGKHDDHVDALGLIGHGLALVVVVAAAYTLAGVGMNMSALTMTRMAIEMPDMAMQPVGWTAVYALVVFLMWCVMMIAMMLPSAAPMLLIHSR